MPNVLWNGVEEWSANQDDPSFVGLAFASSIKQTIFQSTYSDLDTVRSLNYASMINGLRGYVGADPDSSLNGDYVFMGKTATPGSGSWLRVYGGAVGGTLTQRDQAFPAPRQGTEWYRSDLGYRETYFATYNATTNPSGAQWAGWYYSSGTAEFLRTRPTNDLPQGTESAAFFGTILENGFPSLSVASPTALTALRNMRVSVECALRSNGGSGLVTFRRFRTGAWQELFPSWNPTVSSNNIWRNTGVINLMQGEQLQLFMTGGAGGTIVASNSDVRVTMLPTPPRPGS